MNIGHKICFETVIILYVQIPAEHVYCFDKSGESHVWQWLEIVWREAVVSLVQHFVQRSEQTRKAISWYVRAAGRIMKPGFHEQEGILLNKIDRH